MYRHGHKSKKQTRLPLWIVLSFAFIVMLILLVVFASRFIKADTSIQQSEAVTRTVTPSASAYKSFDTPVFKFDLPAEWKQAESVPSQYDIYRFTSGGKTPGTRSVDVYVDTIPTNFPVNRVIALEPSGDKVVMNGEISENCADFTKGPSSPGSTGTLAKWQSIDFLCDLANSARNVVGTSSKGAVNSVTVTGASGAARKLFFVYTENSITPDYAPFTAALNSVVVK